MALLLLPKPIFCQEEFHVVPNNLRKPEIGETPRFAEDLVIGRLGRGNAPEDAYHFAQNLLSDLVADRVSPDPALPGSVLAELRAIRPQNHRLGSGRIEADGSISFLVRFIGREESISGELFLRPGAGAWVFDDLLLDEKRVLSEIRDSFRFDFSPHGRLF